MAAYSVVIQRESWRESKNAYVRWDDYGGGDSAWYGGEIYVYKEYHEHVEEPVWEIDPSIRKAVLRWCEHWLPTDKGLSESPGWKIEFQIMELEWGSGGRSAKVEPVIMDHIRDVILHRASQSLYTKLS